MIRNNEVNIFKYLPEDLEKDGTFKPVGDASSKEHEIIRTNLQDLLDQMFVDTATWGLYLWERIYQTIPPVNADYAVRRSLLKAKMLGLGTMTRSQMEILVNQFVEAHDARVDENIKPGCFRIVLPSAVQWASTMREAVNEMKPAHLAYTLLYDLTADLMDAQEIDEDLVFKNRTIMSEIYPWDYKKHDGSIRYGSVALYNAKRVHDGTSYYNMIDRCTDQYNAETGEKIEVLRAKISGLEDTNLACTYFNASQYHNKNIFYRQETGASDAGGTIKITKKSRFDGNHYYDGGNPLACNGSIYCNGTTSYKNRYRQHKITTITDSM